MNGGKSWLDNMVESVELRDGICRIEFLEEEGLNTKVVACYNTYEVEINFESYRHMVFLREGEMAVYERLRGIEYKPERDSGKLLVILEF